MSPALAEDELSLVPIDTKPSVRALPEGPGWFASSWELRSGLEVREDCHGDASLFGWIESWLQSAGGTGGLSLSAT